MLKRKKILKINTGTLEEFGAVSLVVAREMATSARENLNVDIAISTTGIAGPGGCSKEKPNGTVVIGWSNKNASGSKIYHFGGDRQLLKTKFTEVALFNLLTVIQTDTGPK